MYAHFQLSTYQVSLTNSLCPPVPTTHTSLSFAHNELGYFRFNIWVYLFFCAWCTSICIPSTYNWDIKKLQNFPLLKGWIEFHCVYIFSLSIHTFWWCIVIFICWCLGTVWQGTWGCRYCLDTVILFPLEIDPNYFSIFFFFRPLKTLMDFGWDSIESVNSFMSSGHVFTINITGEWAWNHMGLLKYYMWKEWAQNTVSTVSYLILVRLLCGFIFHLEWWGLLVSQI